MNVKANVARVITLIIAALSMFYCVLKSYEASQIVHLTYSYNSAEDPISWIIMAGLVAFIILFIPTVIIPYETRYVKPTSVTFTKFPTHLAVVINNDRIFTYKENEAMYYQLTEESESRLRCKHQYGLFWFEPEEYKLVMKDLPADKKTEE